MSTAAVIAANEARWQKCIIVPKRELEVHTVAARLAAPKAKVIYQQIADAVWPSQERWWFVAIVHEREASQNFNDSIAQGDPWNEVSRDVPRGIGPFPNFVAAAVFTLTRLPVGGLSTPAKWTDWSVGGVLTLWEAYNGFGYESHHEPSPYDWGATSIEQEGKYVKDGIFNAGVWDTQVGCAAMIKEMMVIDSSIKFGVAA